MSTASDIKAICDKSSASTIGGGYAMTYDSGRALFEPGRILKQNRARDGRLISMTVSYNDGSKLSFNHRGYRVI